jgi:hypothetical protein
MATRCSGPSISGGADSYFRVMAGKEDSLQRIHLNEIGPSRLREDVPVRYRGTVLATVFLEEKKARNVVSLRFWAAVRA